MNMTLSKRGDYVMRAAIYLARSSSESPRKIREVVAETEVPSAFASQILSDLVRAGIATSKAGRGGGYQLSRHPSTITALEIVEAAEGPLAAERCALGSGPCKWDTVCPLHETWFAASQQVREVLAQTSLAELAARDEAIEMGTYAPVSSHRRNPLKVEVSDLVFVERGVNIVSGSLSALGTRVGAVILQAIATDRPAESSPPEIEAEMAAIGPITKDPSRRFQLVWRLRGVDGDSHVEADLVVAEVDDERSQLSAVVEWHQERGVLEADAADRHVRKIVRSLLRVIAHDIEQSVIVR